MTDAATATGEQNWAGNYAYRASRIHRPTTIDEIAAIAQSATSVRVLGSRHSFTDIVDADELIDLSGYQPKIHFDADAKTITVPASTTYGEVAQSLAPHGMALRNLASLPHISVAGAVATATHGSGTDNGNLATSVAGFEYVNAAGEIISVDRSTPDFDGMVVSLGALGIVTSVSLDVVFDYQIEQHVYGELPLNVMGDQLAMVLGAAYSVSVFTTFAGPVDGQVGQVWIKRRTDGSDRSMNPGSTFLDAPAATMQHHPVPAVDGSTCTEQLGVPGPWADRLPHFRMGFTPSAGNEVQSEFFVDSVDGPVALEALRNAADNFSDRLMVGEIRAVAADELWMSPQYLRPSVAFHFTWHPDGGAGGEVGNLNRAVAAVQDALAPFAPRPHWGKVFHADRFSARSSYEMFEDFVELAHRLDPHGVFRNAWWARHLG
jgi:xylitol oxidase